MVASIKPLKIGGAGGLREQSVPDLIQLGDANAYLTGQLNILPNSSSPPYNNSISFLDTALQIKGSIGKTFPGADTFNVTANSGDLFLENGNGDDLLITIGQMLFNGDPVAVEKFSGLQTPTFVNSFNTTGATTPIRYFKVGNWGIISGQVRRAASPAALSVAFNVPVGYRPMAGVTVSQTCLWVYNTLGVQITEVGLSANGDFSVGFFYNLAGTTSGSGGCNVGLVYRIA